MRHAIEMDLQLHLLSGRDKAVLALSGCLTGAAVARLHVRFQSLDRQRIVELDLSDLVGIDEPGLKALQVIERQCARQGRLLILSYPRPSVRRALCRAGIRGQLAPSFPQRRITSVTGLSGRFGPDSSQAG